MRIGKTGFLAELQLEQIYLGIAKGVVVVVLVILSGGGGGTRWLGA